MTDDSRRASAYDKFLDLPRRCLGQLIDEVEPLRHLEVRQLGPRELSKLLLGRRLTGLQHDKGAWRLAPAFVREANHRHLLYGGMTEQATLDIDRRRVFRDA